MTHFFYQRKKSILYFCLLLFLLTSLAAPLNVKAKPGLEKSEPESFALSFLEEIKEFIESPFNKLTVFAQGLGFFPRYPNRLRDLVRELSQASQDLTQLNQELKSQTEQCDCKNAYSQCDRKKTVSPEVFGDACQNRQEIEKNQTAIKSKTDQISYLRELLKKEMETGLEAELKTLREDEANQLRNNLNDILASSGNIIPPALSNIEILNEEKYSVAEKCQAECEQGIPLGFQACIGAIGEQKPIEMKFSIEAFLEELKLGKIGINEIGLNLPEKIKLNAASRVKDFKIPLPDIGIDFPPTPVNKLGDLSLSPIVIHPPSLSLPSFPPTNFSCSNVDSQTYQCQGEEEKSAGSYINFEWYLQTFSWLSEKCQEIPGLKDNYGIPDNRCFDKENVHLTILQQCDALWQEYFGCFDTPFAKCEPPPGICASLYSAAERPKAQQRECQNLFKQENETPPLNCDLNALQNKCSQLKENWEREMPEPCKFLPLFTKQITNPETQTFQKSPTNCIPQTITDNSAIEIGLDCPVSIGSSFNIPELKLPDIIIPDIHLPSFSFPPFLKVKLPNFIFEDLIFPKLDLCDMEDCANLIPPLRLSIPNPILRIPAIELPPFYASLPGLGGVDKKLRIDIDKIEFPDIPIPLPEFDLTKFISLKLRIPQIPIPSPKIAVNFKGVNIDLPNLLLGLVSTIIPIPGGCIGGSLSFIPLVISFSDYYFYWPKFLEIPDLCQNKSNFCQDIKKLLNENVVDKINEIQRIINSSFQNNIQAQLDRLAADFHRLIQESLVQNLEKIRTDVEKAIAESIQKAVIKDGIMTIPPVKVPLDDILISMTTINSQLARIPLEISIPLPDSLKNIKLKTPVGYELPSIPLDNLSYSKEITLKLPGLQLPSLSFSLNFGQFLEFGGKNPSGGNPYPVDKININLEEISGVDKKINEFSSNIDEVLR